MSGTKPREGWLTRVLAATPTAVMAIAAIMLGYALGPAGVGSVNPLFYAMFGGFYGGVALIIAIPLAWGFHALTEARHGTVQATRLAMGEPRSAVIKRAALRGARHGALAAAIGLPVGVLADLVTYRNNEHALGGTPAWLWTTGLLAAATVVTATMAIIHATLAARRTRGAPSGALATAAGGEPEPSASGKRRAWIVWLALAAVSAVLPMWHRVYPLPDNGHSPLIIAKNVSIAVLFVALVAIGIRVAADLAALGRRVDVGLLRRGTSLHAARTLAADSLARNSQHTRRAGSLTAVMIGLAAFGATWTAVDTARAALHSSLTGPVAITAYDATPRSNFDRQYLPPLGPEGYAPEVLDASYVSSLRADGRLIVVPYALLRDDSSTYELITAEGNSSTEAQQESLLVIDPAAADAVAPHLLARLAVEGRIYTAGWGQLSDASSSGSPRSFAGIEPGLQSIWLGDGHPIVSAQSTSDSLGNAPINGVLLFPADAGVDVAAAVNHSALPPTATFVELDRIQPTGPAYAFLSYMGGFALLIATPFIAAVAVMSSRLRRREQATMAALGATRRDLQWVPAIEAGVVGFTGAVAGIVIGVISALAASDPLAWMPGAPVTVSGLCWRAIDALAATPWASLAAIAVLGAVLPAAVATLATWGSANASPVEQLREAVREGAP
ncbi:MAG: FtsX-like permease family protein [Demequinaceae bacterium]|nr:FtsX-like permease family protein [Demequinaceae bacterium]